MNRKQKNKPKSEMNIHDENFIRLFQKIIAILFSVFFTFILIFFFFRQKPGSYSEQQIARMSNPTSKNASFSELPVTVKYLNDASGNLECRLLPSQLLKPFPKDGYLSSYDGVTWIDIVSENISDSYGIDYILEFGIEPFLFAEVFREDNGSWYFYGKTGRIYKRAEMSIPAWIPSIPVYLNDFHEQVNSIHLRVKLVTPIPIPLKVKLLTQNYFLYKYSIDSVVCFSLSGVFLLSAIILLLYGIVYKDKTYSFISISSFLLLFATLDLRGISTCYFWNSFYYPRTSTWLIFFLGGSSLMFFAKAVGQLVEEYSSSVKFKFCIPLANLVTSSSLLVLVFINKPYTNFYIFISTVFIVLLILLSFIYVNNVSIKHSGGRLLVTWTFLIIICAFRLSMHLIRKSTSFSLFNLVCNDFYCSYDFINGMLLFPVFSTLIGRARRYNKILVARNSIAYKKSGRQNELIEQYQKLFSEIEENHSIITNTIKLINETDTAETKGNLSKIQRTSSYIEMILRINRLISNKDIEQKDVIQLLPFFISCKKATDSLAKLRGNHISVKANMQDDFTIITNRDLLMFLFTEYLIFIIEYSPRYTNIAISLDDVRQTLTYKVAIDSKSPEELRKNIILSTDYKYKLFNEGIKLLKGTFETTAEADKLILTIKIKHKKAEETLRSSLRQEQADSSFIEASEYNIGNLINISSDNFTIAGHTPVILIIEENLKILEQISVVLSKKCTILHSTNGLEAWNLLISLKNTSLPDLIITDLHNPVMEGDELLRKCSIEENLNTIPFIFLLPHYESDRKNMLMSKGAVNCITKPFDIQELFFTIYSTLNLKEMYYRETVSRISHAVYSHSDEQIVTVEKKTSQKRSKVQQNLGSPNRTITLTASQTSLFEDALLSSRERQIALLISEGKTDKQISEELFISAATVATHNKKIFKKLGVHSRVELMNKVR